MKTIHPNIKFLPSQDFALPPMEVANVNNKFSEGYSELTDEFGNSRL